MGTLSPGLTRILREAAGMPVAWDAALPYLAGRVLLQAVVETARPGRLGRIAGDLGTLARHTSPAETLVLVRRVRNAEDAARLARRSIRQRPVAPRTIPRHDRAAAGGGG